MAGNTDEAEQLATEALQIGSDGGEHDATSSSACSSCL
jgi:hypothetical protein